jgi:hypothetical protein
MSKILSFYVIVAIFLATSVFVTGQQLDVLRQRLRREVPSNDPCNFACGAMQDAIIGCTNSTDTFCGCEVWIKDAASCTACSLVFNNSTSIFGDVLNEIIRAFCLCPSDCGPIATATFSQGFHIEEAPQVCPFVQTDSQTCVTCIQRQDPYTAEVVVNYFAQLC